MKTIYGILGGLLVTLAMVSCSEDIKLQNALTKDGGRWDISEIKTTVVISTTPDIPVIVQQFAVGEMLFYENGTGVWIQYDTLIMQNIATYFDWENTNSEIFIDPEGEPIEIGFDVNQVSKEEQWWVRSEEVVDGTIITTTTIEINIKRKETVDNL